MYLLLPVKYVACGGFTHTRTQAVLSNPAANIFYMFISTDPDVSGANYIAVAARLMSL